MFKRFIPRYLKNVFQRLYLKIKFPKAIIESGVEISIHSILKGRCKLSHGATFCGELGYGSNIGDNSKILGKVGKFCSIAPDVDVIVGVHPYTYPYVTTAPPFYSNLKQCGFNYSNQQSFNEFKFADSEHKYPIIIGNDVWIQRFVKIVSGVKIGDGSVILAGAVVTKDIPPYAIVGGVPAKILKYRFSEDDIKLLVNFKWWEKGEKWWSENWNLLCNFDSFKTYLKNHRNE